MINKLRSINDKTFTWEQEFALMQKLSKLFQLAGDDKSLSKTLNDKNKKPEEILFDSWEIILHDFARKYDYQPEGTLQLFYSDRKNYEELAYQESTLEYNSEGLPFKIGPLILRDVITTEFIHEIKKYFLLNLNKALAETERQVIEQAIIFLEKGQTYAQQYATNKYDVELTISYFISNYNDVAYTFSSAFDYRKIVIEKNYGKFLNDNNEQNIHRSQTLPKLNEPYSFLLVDVINNASLRNKIYEIVKIEAEVIYTYYGGLKMNKEKNSITFQYNENSKIFEQSETDELLQDNTGKDLKSFKKLTNTLSMPSETWEKEYNDLLEKSKAKQNSQEETDALLARVRKGDKNAIEPLVESSALMILSVIKSFPNEIVSVKEMFETGKNELKKLAKYELNSSVSERFFRFATWNIKQAILKKIREAENKK